MGLCGAFFLEFIHKNANILQQIVKYLPCFKGAEYTDEALLSTGSSGRGLQPVEHQPAKAERALPEHGWQQSHFQKMRTQRTGLPLPALQSAALADGFSCLFLQGAAPAHGGCPDPCPRCQPCGTASGQRCHLRGVQSTSQGTSTNKSHLIWCICFTFLPDISEQNIQYRTSYSVAGTHLVLQQGRIKTLQHKV